jgi:hypothetical protein
MTRDEAQALAEELVLRLARHSYEKRGMGLDQMAATYKRMLSALKRAEAAESQLAAVREVVARWVADEPSGDCMNAVAEAIRPAPSPGAGEKL